MSVLHLGSTVTVAGSVVNLNGGSISNAAQPVNPNDLSTKAYTDLVVSAQEARIDTILSGVSVDLDTLGEIVTYFNGLDSAASNGVASSVATLSNSVAAETSRATAAEAALGTQITNLSASLNVTIKAGDDTLSALITAEETRARAAEVALGTAAQSYANTARSQANTYTDSAVASTLSSANTYADGVAATAVTSAIASANSYTDSAVASTLSSANTYADGVTATALAAANSAAHDFANQAINRGQLYADAAAATAVTSAITSANSYTDQVSQTARNDAINSAQSYTDGVADAKLLEANTYADTTAATTLSSANTYADGAAATTLTSAIESANAFTEGVIASTVDEVNSYADEVATSAIATANSYADGVAATTLTSANTHADAAAATTLTSAIASANSHTDSTLTTATTSIVSKINSNRLLNPRIANIGDQPPISIPENSVVTVNDGWYFRNINTAPLGTPIQALGLDTSNFLAPIGTTIGFVQPGTDATVRITKNSIVKINEGPPMELGLYPIVFSATGYDYIEITVPGNATIRNTDLSSIIFVTAGNIVLQAGLIVAYDAATKPIPIAESGLTTVNVTVPSGGTVRFNFDKTVPFSIMQTQMLGKTFLVLQNGTFNLPVGSKINELESVDGETLVNANSSVQLEFGTTVTVIDAGSVLVQPGVGVFDSTGTAKGEISLIGDTIVTVSPGDTIVAAAEELVGSPGLGSGINWKISPSAITSWGNVNSISLNAQIIENKVLPNIEVLLQSPTSPELFTHKIVYTLTETQQESISPGGYYTFWINNAPAATLGYLPIELTVLNITNISGAPAPLPTGTEQFLAAFITSDRATVTGDIEFIANQVSIKSNNGVENWIMSNDSIRAEETRSRLDVLYQYFFHTTSGTAPS